MTIKPINNWAYRQSSPLTIEPIDHQQSGLLSRLLSLSACCKYLSRALALALTLAYLWQIEMEICILLWLSLTLKLAILSYSCKASLKNGWTELLKFNVSFKSLSWLKRLWAGHWELTHYWYIYYNNDALWFLYTPIALLHISGRFSHGHYFFLCHSIRNEAFCYCAALPWRKKWLFPILLFMI